MSELAGPVAPIGVFGGTFNPIHHGHLRSAVELVDQLQLAKLYFMPAAVPPHRPAPACSAEQRAAMIELATSSERRLQCDRRELARPGPSYTIDSLAELRAEVGPARSLCLIIGSDALQGITGWHRWRELLDYSHIVAIARPGWKLPVTGEIALWLQRHQLGDRAQLNQQPSGGIVLQQLRPLSISATDIRAQLRAGKSVRYLLPDNVLDYITLRHLYTDEHIVSQLNQPPG